MEGILQKEPSYSLVKGVMASDILGQGQEFNAWGIDRSRMGRPGLVVKDLQSLQSLKAGVGSLKVYRWAFGQRMHYLDEGSGPPLLMVHGNPTWSLVNPPPEGIPFGTPTYG